MRKKIENRSGFTLAEVLMAVLIVAMVSAVVAAGIPSAINAYKKVTEAGNADLLLSTTITRLRDELGTASDVSVNGTTVTYTNGAGSRSYLELVTTGDKPGIYLQEYADIVTSENRDKFYHLLVSDEAASKTMHVTYELDGAPDADGVLTFRNLAVKRGTETLNTIATLKIRVLAE